MSNMGVSSPVTSVNLNRMYYNIADKLLKNLHVLHLECFAGQVQTFKDF